MSKQKVVYNGTCIVCKAGEVTQIGKDEVRCENCKSQYPLKLQKKSTQKGK